jgi:aspartate aminotransferase
MEEAVSSATRLLIVNSPNNPSGRIYDRSLLQSMAEVALKHNLWVVTDHAYVDLAFDQPVDTILGVAPELKEQTIVVESFSKRFSMTGLRLGAALGPREVIGGMVSLASTATTHPNTITQHMGLAALADGQEWIAEQRQRYRGRRDLAAQALQEIPGLTLGPSQAAMFLFPNISALLRKRGLGSDRDLARILLDEAGLRVVPGSAFGAPGHLRLSYGLEDARLREAMARMASVLGV